jgi:methyltransferase (TIGR00027 family)
MTRTDNDTWDLASSVGATATLVDAARAMASRADRPLIADPFAEPLVHAVGVELFTRLATGELNPADFSDDGSTEGPMNMARMADNMAVRTLFFDECFLDATDTGIRQAVILASGLDARAYRLAWPAGTTVYEVDQPEVIEFKTRTLADLGAEPTADRRPVPIDLRDDWPAALRAAGFDPAQPTVWSAEGLLGYLPPEAQDRLLDTITALSAPGSRFATESTPPLDPADEDKMRDRMQSIAEKWRSHGFDLDIAGLIYFGDRNEAAGYLAEHGWQVSSRSVNELLAAHGLPPMEDDTGFADLAYVSGTLGTLDNRNSNMARTDSRFPGDSWDLASSVGTTATMVAAARALATAEPDALINDPFAAPLVRAVGIDFFTGLVDGHMPDGSGDRPREVQRMATSLAVRTRFFDEFFAAQASPRQAVILAAGLDSRAYRLAWPPGSTVYEVDQPQVVDFKTATMSALGAEPATRRRTVSIDLRNDWPNALRHNGFDEGQPAAWSAEGLLMYLPPDAQDRLFDNITALSAPGSRLATEYHPDDGGNLNERARVLTDRWREYGYNLDMTELFYGGERSNVVDYLTNRGWQVTTRTRRELFANYGRQFPDDDPLAAFRNIVAVTATLG